MEGRDGSFVVIGAAGMLGTDLMEIFHRSFDRVVGMDIDEIDITDMQSVKQALAGHEGSIVVNLAAMTDVDGCEARVEEAFRVNAQGPANLAQWVDQSGSFLVHISTDYVFDGTKTEPYKEDDPTGPMGAYGRSKEQGEVFIPRILPTRHCIVRTSWLYGLHGKNFIEAILSAAAQRDVLTVVNDQRGRPTFTRDFAEALVAVCRLGLTGTYHVANSGEATWYDFSVEILKQAGLSRVRVEPITTEQLARPAPRPRYSVLDTSRFENAAGMRLRPWQEALQDYLTMREKGRA
jgi:dTDP-4-dehydrorhamnose reductase